MFNKSIGNIKGRIFICCMFLMSLAACGGGNPDKPSSTAQSSSSSSQFLPQTAYGSTTTIVAEHSGKCLDVRGGPTATQDGAIIEQWTCSGEANQDWNLNNKGNGNYELIARSSGKCIEPIGGGVDNYTNIQQATCDGSSKQLWNVRPKAAAGYYEIVSANAGRCLDVTGGPTATQDGVYTEL